MKMLKKTFLVTLLLILVFSFPVHASSGKIIMEKSNASVTVGKSITLRAIAKGKSKKITWKSSNTKIATVNSSGKVIGKKAGKVTITAKANGVKAKCKVTVLSKKAAKIAAAKKYYKELMASYDFVPRFSVEDLTGDGIPELIFVNSNNHVFVDIYEEKTKYSNNPTVTGLCDGQVVYVNKSKKVMVGWDHDNYNKSINNKLYRNMSTYSFTISSFKKQPNYNINYIKYNNYSGGYNGCIKQSSNPASLGYYNKFTKIKLSTYNSDFKKYTKSAKVITSAYPKYANTSKNRNKYLK